MQSARGMHGNVWDWVQSDKGMQGNEGEYKGNECMGVDAKCQGNAGESCGMLEHMVVQSARPMPGKHIGVWG